MALVGAGTWDGRASPANAHAVAAGMPRAEVLVVPRASHDLFQDPAASAALLRFLEAALIRAGRL